MLEKQVRQRTALKEKYPKDPPVPSRVPRDPETGNYTDCAARIREIYGVAAPVFIPEEDEKMLFRIPESRKAPRTTPIRGGPAQSGSRLLWQGSWQRRGC